MPAPMIAESRFSLARPDKVTVAAYRWTFSRSPRAIMVVAHGMGEHARRYPPALATLLESDIDLYGIDHRGHGVTLAFSTQPPGAFGPGGFSLVPDSMASLFSQGSRLADPVALSGIGTDLPLYILVGERDPLVSDIGKLDRLIERYRGAGLRPVVARYPQGRHEILNEINRAEVVQGLLAWLNGVIDKIREDRNRLNG